jgi:release factor glutamine methyltransferase
MGIALSVASVGAMPLTELDSERETTLRELVVARLNGTPLAYLTERQQFMGIDFISTPEAVIPRKDTETLTHGVLQHIQKNPGADGPLSVLDVFTGSGNVALALAKLAPGHVYYGTDLSAEAIGLANRNASYLGLDSVCAFRCGDMFTPFQNEEFLAKVDLISAAPPFISSSKISRMPGEIVDHEPILALEAGPFGLKLLLRLIAEAPALLKPRGWLFSEVGLGQGPGLAQRLAADGRYRNVQLFSDDKGDVRAVAAQKISAESTVLGTASAPPS